MQGERGTLCCAPSTMEVQESSNSDGSKLYKTEICRSWEETGTCRYGNKCQFAHGKQDLRPVNRHPKYKTEICRTFTADGTCPYGRRCRFIHAPADGNAAQKAPAAPPMKTSSFTRYLDINTMSPRSRLPVFQQICPGPSLVY